MRLRSLNTLLRVVLACVDALARDAVVLGSIPRDERFPDVVVREVAVLVVRRIDVREVEGTEAAHQLARVAEHRTARTGDQFGHAQLDGLCRARQPTA